MEFSLLLDESVPIVNQETLISGMLKYDFAAEEIEDFLQASHGSVRQKSYHLYEHLVEVYKREGSAEAKRKVLEARLSKNISYGTDYTLWLALTADEDVEVSADALKITGARLGFYKNLSNYHLREMARIYAQSGDMEQAADIYRLFILRRTYGLFTGPWQVMTETQFVDEVNHYITGPLRLKLIEDVINLIEKKGEQAGGGSRTERFLAGIGRVTQDFVIATLMKSYPTEEALKRIEDMYGTPDQEWLEESLVTVMGLQVRTGRQEQALEALKHLLKKIPPADGVDSVQVGTHENVVLGVNPFGRGEPYGDVYIQRRFLTNSIVMPRDKAGVPWLEQMQAGLNKWIDEDSVEMNEALRVMGVIAYRLHQAGEEEKSKSVMSDISGHLRSSEWYFGRQAVSFIVEAGRAAGHPVDLDVMQAFSEEGRLEFPLMTDVVRRRGEKSVSGALALGEKLMAYTTNDELLEVMITLTEKSGGDAAKLRKLRSQVAKSRETYHAHHMGRKLMEGEEIY